MKTLLLCLALVFVSASIWSQPQRHEFIQSYSDGDDDWNTDDEDDNDEWEGDEDDWERQGENRLISF
jgi:hypothetical protein